MAATADSDSASRSEAERRIVPSGSGRSTSGSGTVAGGEAGAGHGEGALGEDDPVAGADPRRPLDRRAVDQGAVARTEVLHHQVGATSEQSGVVAGEEAIGEHQVGVGGAADHQRAVGHFQVERRAFRRHDVQGQHREFLLANSGWYV